MSASMPASSMTRPDLHSLLERVRSAEKGSRELDAELAVVLTGAEAPPYPQAHPPGTVIRDGKFEFAPPISAYLDVVVSLIEKELPGWAWLRKSERAMTVYRRLTDDEDARKEWAKHYDEAGATPALALLAALLSAKLSMENADAEA